METMLTQEERYVRKYLVARAKMGSDYTYSELNDEAVLGYDLSISEQRGKFGHLLGNISRFEVENGRPMISAIVIDRNSRLQGSGFFAIAEEIGLWNGRNKELFSNEERKRVKNYWKAHTDLK